MVGGDSPSGDRSYGCIPHLLAGLSLEKNWRSPSSPFPEEGLRDHFFTLSN